VTSTKHRFLAIETSSARLSLAIGTEAGVIRQYQGPLEWRHAESLFEGMDRLLRAGKWPVQSLTGIAVSTGPGSFTGIRIGLAAARAFGQTMNIPVVGISSLRTLAAPILRADRLVCSVIDALRGEVFCGLYARRANGEFKIIWKETRLPLQTLFRQLTQQRNIAITFVGDAVGSVKDALSNVAKNRWTFTDESNAYPQAGALLRLAQTKLQKGTSRYDQVAPFYLRAAAAIERRKS
jgi:tRNA threonylcarbamoyladenosine biosynthesis protein TsaB